MHEIRVHFWRDSRIPVHQPCLEFDLQDLCAGIISNGAQDAGLNGYFFHGYRHVLTGALEG